MCLERQCCQNSWKFPDYANCCFSCARCTQPHLYKWADAEGHTHEIWQHEGGEQGDPLMPLLFSLAIHNELAEVKGQMQDGAGQNQSLEQRGYVRP